MKKDLDKQVAEIKDSFLKIDQAIIEEILDLGKKIEKMTEDGSLDSENTSFMGQEEKDLLIQEAVKKLENAASYLEVIGRQLGSIADVLDEKDSEGLIGGDIVHQKRWDDGE